MLSTYSASRLAQALAEKDLAALTQVSGVGKKKAERIALELADKVADLALDPSGSAGGAPPPEGAVSALMALGYSFAEADAAVRGALADGEDLSTEALIRLALAGN
jgi:Holliday junction DNA helicase RuvA